MNTPTKAPPVIDGPGEYVTMCGRKALVFRGRGHIWFGHLEHALTDLRWYISGVCYDISGEYDIIGKWVEPTPALDAPSYEELAVQVKAFRMEAILKSGQEPQSADYQLGLMEGIAKATLAEIDRGGLSNILSTHDARIRAEAATAEREACAQTCEFLANVAQQKANDDRLASRKKALVAMVVTYETAATAIRARSEGEGGE